MNRSPLVLGVVLAGLLAGPGVRAQEHQRGAEGSGYVIEVGAGLGGGPASVTQLALGLGWGGATRVQVRVDRLSQFGNCSLELGSVCELDLWGLRAGGVYTLLDQARISPHAGIHAGITFGSTEAGTSPRVALAGEVGLTLRVQPSVLLVLAAERQEHLDDAFRTQFGESLAFDMMRLSVAIRR